MLLCSQMGIRSMYMYLVMDILKKYKVSKLLAEVSRAPQVAELADVEDIRLIRAHGRTRQSHLQYD